MITLQDVFQAYFDCRKNKRKAQNAISFEIDYEARVLNLYDDIIKKRYKMSIARLILFVFLRQCIWKQR